MGLDDLRDGDGERLWYAVSNNFKYNFRTACAAPGDPGCLNSDSRAEYVTWFVQARGIAFHYFPIVPRHAASHGCVRLETKRTARLIQDNARIGRTKVTIGGTWTKPPKQW